MISHGSRPVARVSGDEFVILLGDVNEGATQAVTEKVLQALRDVRVPCGNTTLTPSASIGAVTCMPPGDNAWTPESLLNAADLELYTAKAEGRDGSSHRNLALT